MRVLFVSLLLVLMSSSALAVTPKSVKAKFYDFGVQVLDGTIKKPTVTYTGAVERARFSRLLRLKKSFMSQIHRSAKESVFK